MTASHSCRACGAELPRDIRWCARCYEPVRELSPRARLHDGDFVGRPIHERGNIPRWSRWEKTATTFGPWGRIVATALVLLTLVPAISLKGIVYLVTFPFFAVIVLREIWSKGWFVPDDDTAPVDPEPPVADEPRTSDPITVPRLLRWGLGSAALLAFVYGPVEIKEAVLGLSAVALLWWFWTTFDDR